MIMSKFSNALGLEDIRVCNHMSLSAAAHRSTLYDIHARRCLTRVPATWPAAKLLLRLAAAGSCRKLPATVKPWERAEISAGTRSPPGG